MKKARILFVICLLTFCFVLAACNKDGQLDLKSIIETGTPTPDENVTTPEPTKAEEPTKEVTSIEEPTAEPTEEPTPEPTEEPTPTEPEITEEPTPEVTAEPKYPDEDVTYDVPELLILGISSDGNSEWKDGKKVYEVSYDKLILSDEEKEEYDNLALRFDIMNMEQSDIGNVYIDMYNTYMEDGNILEGESQYYFYRHDYDILRADSYVVSLSNTDAYYEGGSHPEHGTVGISIDTETGEMLKLSDICNDCASLGTMIAYKLDEKYGLWEEEDRIDELISSLDQKIADDELTFTIGYEGVTFYFTPYEIASYADGNLSVILSLDETFVGETEDGPAMIGLFKKKYRTVPDRYMLSLTPGTGIELLDLVEEDGHFDELTVCEIPNEKYPNSSMGHYILLNREEIFRKENIFCDENEYYYVKAGDRKLVIIKTSQDSDDTFTYIYQLENGELINWTEDGIVYGFEFGGLKDYYGDGVWDYSITDETVYDPANVSVGSRFDVIGTCFVSKKISFNVTGEDELFEYLSPYYDFTGRHELTLKKDFKAGMIDPETAFNGGSPDAGGLDIEIELSAGDVIYLEKCTSEGQIFFTTDNGEWGTFFMEDTSDPDDPYTYFSSINGEYMTEVFDGISFAD